MVATTERNKRQAGSGWRTWGAGIGVAAVAMALLFAGSAEAAQYREGRSFTAGTWKGEVKRNPRNGKMRCEMTDEYGEGAFVRLIWGENGFAMAFHKRGWGLDKGRTQAYVRIDQRWASTVKMQVNERMAVLSFGFKDDPINAVRDGNKIYLDIDGDSTSWTLNGTNAAIGVLYDCYKNAIAN